MTFKDAYTELLSLVNQPDVQRTRQAKLAINRALRWILNKHEFKFAEDIQEAVYPANTLLFDITSALPIDRLISVEYKLGQNSYLPLTLLTWEELVAKQQLDRELARCWPDEYEAINDPQFSNVVGTYAKHVQSVHKFFVVLHGKKIGLFPVPSHSVTLRIQYKVKFRDLCNDDDEHFLLNEAYDLVMLKAINSTFRAYLSPTMTDRFPPELLAVEMDAIITWDNQLRTHTRSII